MPGRTPPRHRKSAAEAREVILDAAEKRLRAAGPGSIRLQEIASDVGVSHPAILHHFKSRAGLVHAVVVRAIERLQADLLASLAATRRVPMEGARLLDRVFEVLSDRGHARLIAWLLLSGHDPFASEASKVGWAKIIELTHSLRTPEKRSRGGRRTASYQDTRFTVVLSALVLFGEAIAGDATFRVAGLVDSPRTARAFRKWLATLIMRHL
jgi:AcrR family transcriptional regulator